MFKMVNIGDFKLCVFDRNKKRQQKYREYYNINVLPGCNKH